MLVSGPVTDMGSCWGVCGGSRGFTARLLRSTHSHDHVHFCRLLCLATSLGLSFACLITMGSRGTNNSLQTAPVFTTASSGEEASLQHVLSSTSDNVLPSNSLQAPQALLQPAGTATAGVSPEMVALISQTVQAALAPEWALLSAAQSTSSQPS